MPKKIINDYEFYKIINVNEDINLCFIGSTSNWKSKQRSHRQACNNENHSQYNFKVYQKIREYGGWCEFKMVLIGERKQLTLKQARAVEDEYRIEMRANLNDSKMHRTAEQIKTDKKLNSRKHYEIDKELTKKYNDISKVAKAYYANLEQEQNDTNYMSYDDVV